MKGITSNRIMGPTAEAASGSICDDGDTPTELVNPCECWQLEVAGQEEVDGRGFASSPQETPDGASLGAPHVCGVGARS